MIENKKYKITTSCRILTLTEEKDIIQKIRNTNDINAKTILFTSHLNLVKKIARKNLIKPFDINDLIQQGILGLESTLVKFDPSFNCRFSTLAKYWIQLKISEYIKKNIKCVEVPIGISNNIFKFKKCGELFTKENSREPSHIDYPYFAKKLDWKIEYVYLIGNLVKSDVQFKHVHLNDNSSEYTSNLFYNLLDDRDNPLESLMRRNNIANIESIVSNLKDRERFIIESRYGLKGRNRKNLKELSDDLNLTKERVRQLQLIAEKQIKNNFLKYEKIN